MSTTINIEHIKSLRQKFLDSNPTTIDPKNEFIRLVSMVYHIDGSQMCNIEYCKLRSEKVFTNEEYENLFKEFNKNFIMHNWINTGMSFTEKNEELITVLDKLRNLLPYEMVYKSYLEYLTAKMCIVYVNSFEVLYPMK